MPVRYFNQQLSSFAKLLTVNNATSSVLVATNTLRVGNSTVFYTVGANALFSNNSLNLGGIPANNYITNFIDSTISANVTLNANLVFNSTATIVANGTMGVAGQMLFTNGTSVYWSTHAPSKITMLADVDANNLPGEIGSTSAPANGSVLTYVSDYDKYFVLPLNVTNVQDIPLSNTVMDGGEF